MSLQSIRNRLEKLEKREGRKSGRVHVVYVPGVVPLTATEEQCEAAQAQALANYEAGRGAAVPKSDRIIFVVCVNGRGAVENTEQTEAPETSTHAAEIQQAKETAPGPPENAQDARTDARATRSTTAHAERRERERHERGDQWSAF